MIDIKTNRVSWERSANLTALDLSSSDVISSVQKRVRVRLHKITRRAFVTKGVSTKGGAWPQLSPGYAKAKAVRFGQKGLMRKTDRLFKSFTLFGGEEIFKLLRGRDQFVIFFGSSVPYASFHPNRKVLDPTDAQLAAISLDVASAIKLIIIKRKWFDKDSGSSIKTTGFDEIGDITGGGGL